MVALHGQFERERVEFYHFTFASSVAFCVGTPERMRSNFKWNRYTFVMYLYKCLCAPSNHHLVHLRFFSKFSHELKKCKCHDHYLYAMLIWFDCFAAAKRWNPYQTNRKNHLKPVSQQSRNQTNQTSCRCYISMILIGGFWWVCSSSQEVQLISNFLVPFK